MLVESKIFLRRKFSEYYSRNNVSAPSEIEKREFGVGTLTEKIKVRHKSFKSEKDLQNFLRREAPYYISYSVAFYDFPENEMSEKVWRGAELVFDLDIDMPLLDAIKLEEVKKEAASLLDYLTKDFGISMDDISINFSGGKGYHIHVLNDGIRFLGKDERRELVDYMTGGINFKDFLSEEGDSREPTLVGPRKGDRGWRGRIFEGLYSFIRDADEKKLREIDGIGEKKAEAICKRKDAILSSLDEGRYDLIPEIVQIERTAHRTRDPNIREYGIGDVKSPLIENIVKHLAIKMAAEDTDKMVTMDITRLIRLPNTIHGGSGLVAKKVSDLESFKAFDPLKDALAFTKHPTKIILNQVVGEFDLGGERLGPFEAGPVELPEYAAIYLLLKDKADVPTS
jgi:DNA primase small subunit